MGSSTIVWALGASEVVLQEVVQGLVSDYWNQSVGVTVPARLQLPCVSPLLFVIVNLRQQRLCEPPLVFGCALS